MSRLHWSKTEKNTYHSPPQRYPRIRLVILGDSDDGGFKEGGRVGPLFKAGLEAAGFEVNLFDNQQLDFQEVFEAGLRILEINLIWHCMLLMLRPPAIRQQFVWIGII